MNIYLTHTDLLMSHTFWFYEDLNIEPKKKHYGLSINYSDIKERRDEFLGELLNTIVDWVYHKNKQYKLFNERLKDTNFGNALNFITNQAYSKFRTGHPQGQFGELLLFNLIQHYYKNENDKNIFILGESKCYESKYQFKRAFEASIQSIVKTFNELDKELNLYSYDDFIEPELEELIKKYKQGKLDNIRYELVCLIAYNENQEILGNSEEIIKSNIKKVIQNKCASINKNSFSNIEKNILARVNYIIFPIWELDRLLNDFQNKVGSNK